VDDAARREHRIGVFVLAGIGGVGWLLTIVATVAKGIGGAAISLGVMMLVLGVGALLVGGPRWALIASRSSGAALVAVGVAMAMIGVVLLPTAASPKFGYFDAPADVRPANPLPSPADRER
jgi:hypothetical protein